MTAAKTHRGAAPAKGMPSKAGSSKVKPASAKSGPATKAAARAPAKATKAAAKPVPAPRPMAAPKRPPAVAAPPSKAAPATANAKASAPAKGVTAPKPVATKAAAKTAVAKTPAKPGRKGRGDPGSEANLHKRVDSERIAEHIAAFEKSGGRVEKLGVTRVLQRVTEVAASAPAQASKTGGRRR